MFDSLDKKFDVEPTLPDPTPPVAPVAVEISDEEKSRLALRDMIDKGSKAVEDALALASGTQSPRAFEVLAQMIKTVSDSSKDLIMLQKIKKDVGKSEKGNSPKTQNNLFFGSTTELLRAMEKANMEVRPIEDAEKLIEIK